MTEKNSDFNKSFSDTIRLNKLNINKFIHFNNMIYSLNICNE